MKNYKEGQGLNPGINGFWLGVTALLLLSMVGILGFTLSSAREQKIQNIILDLAGEQDALNQLYLNEVLLKSHGAKVDLQSTFKKLNTFWDVLANGGRVMIGPESEMDVDVPPPPTESIRGQLHEQNQLMRQIRVKGDQFLKMSPNDAQFGESLQELQSLNQDIHNLTDTIERGFTLHSESQLFTQSHIAAFLGLSVGIIGLFLSAQLKRSNKKLQGEIRERNRAEEALRLSEERFELAVQGTSDGMWDSGQPLTVEPWNYPQAPVWYSPRFKELLGYTEENFDNVRDSWLSRLHPEDQPRVFSALREHLEGRVPYDVDFRMKTRQGSDRWFNGRGQALWDDRGEPIRMAGFIRDITERKRAEEALRESETKRIEAFRQSDSLKSALLSSVSHELRTPLTTIKASVSSLLGQEPEGTAAVREEFLQVINLETDYLNRLVENLLDMSRIEAGALVPRCEWHPFEEIIEGAVQQTVDVMKDHPLEVYIEDGLPPVYVDGLEIQQVLINLLDNATKYSFKSVPVKIEATCTSGNLEVRVSDRGEGIPPQDIEKIFERFYRVPVQRDHSIRGTGLGLSICKSIVEAHGGRIWVEPTKGGGATMAFSIPLQKPPAIQPWEDQPQQLVPS